MKRVALAFIIVVGIASCGQRNESDYKQHGPAADTVAYAAGGNAETADTVASGTPPNRSW